MKTMNKLTTHIMYDYNFDSFFCFKFICAKYISDNTGYLYII